MERWRRFAAANPFLILGFIALVIVVFGSMPNGHDYDPDPFRTFLREWLFPVAIPYFVAVFVFDSLGVRESYLLVPAMIALGLLQYSALDAAWRFTRRRFTKGSTVLLSLALVLPSTLSAQQLSDTAAVRLLSPALFKLLNNEIAQAA